MKTQNEIESKLRELKEKRMRNNPLTDKGKVAPYFAEHEAMFAHKIEILDWVLGKR